MQIGECIYVLHAFQKKSPLGIKTAQKDVDLIKKRYKQALEISKEKKSMTEEIISVEFTESSGNVFADLDLDDGDELLTRAKLGFAVRKMLENRNLKQQEIANLLNIKQPEVSNLMKGKYHLFSESRLFNFLNKLEQKIMIQITPHHTGEPLIDVAIR